MMQPSPCVKRISIQTQAITTASNTVYRRITRDERNAASSILSFTRSNTKSCEHPHESSRQSRTAFVWCKTNTQRDTNRSEKKSPPLQLHVSSRKYKIFCSIRSSALISRSSPRKLNICSRLFVILPSTMISCAGAGELWVAAPTANQEY